MTGRLVVVVAIVVFVLVANRLYRSWRARIVADDAPVPHLPAALLAGADHTWVVFTTPLCATCGPVVERLQAHHPAARVVKVDATEEPSLADAFRIRSAPTALLADRRGEVLTRLVGPQSVDDYVRRPA